MRGLLSFYGSTPSYKPVLDVEGWGDVQPELNAMSKRGEWAKMPELITDQMVETIAIFGTPCPGGQGTGAALRRARRACLPVLPGLRDE